VIPATRESGRALVGLLCVAFGLIGLLGVLVVGGQASRTKLDERVATLEADLAARTAELESISEVGSRARLELADAKDAAKKAEGLLAESRAETTALRADLERVGAERDEHLAARITLQRKLDDALELLATHGK
jgi:chromosome segregation ATPase